MLAMAGIVIRLAVLQVRESGTYAELGSTQRVHTEPLPAVRGEMLDRTGVPMALTLEARDVYANPSLVVDASTEADQVARVLGLKEKDVSAARTFLAFNPRTRAICSASAEASTTRLGFA